MPDYRLGTVTAVDTATLPGVDAICDVNVDGTTLKAKAFGQLPGINWQVWVEQRGSDRQDWVICDIQVPPAPAPGQLIATTSGTGTLSSSGTTEVAGSAATAGIGLASVALSSLRSYRVEIFGRIQQSATSGSVAVRVRASTGTVTTASTEILRSLFPVGGTGGGFAFELVLAGTPWTPASTGLWNLAVTVSSANAATNGQWSDAVGTLNRVISLYAV